MIRYGRHLLGILLGLGLSANALADPVEVFSPPLRPVSVKSDRAMGRIFVQANFSSHHIVVDGVEYPAYLSDYGIEVTSNELHEVKVSNGVFEKKYKLSVNPNESLMLYVDLGGATQKPAADNKADNKKKEDANLGYITVTAESEAQVYVDGKLMPSKTPMRKQEVSTGTHSVRVYFLDTRKFSKTREVYVGKGATMSVNFTKE